MIVICPYCQKKALLVPGSSIYPHRRDLHQKQFYQCEPCDAWVGCHDGTICPLGRLANSELRSAKMAAHAAFDPLWRRKIAAGANKKEARAAGYRWLAEQLGIPAADCHIGMFDVELCHRVAQICRPYGEAEQIADALNAADRGADSHA